MIEETLTPHPYAACYPLVSGTLEESLYESIKLNGLRQPIVLWRDSSRSKLWLIDGRNRYRALCQIYGGVSEKQVIWQSYNNDEAVRLAVLDYNENRRQMSTAQKSVVAGRIIEARSKLFITLNELKTNQGTDESSLREVDTLAQLASTGQDDEPPFESMISGAIIQHKDNIECPPEVRREVASTLGIGPKTAQRGAAVVSRGAPKLVDALEEGLVSVEAAYTLTQLDDDELESVVTQGKEVMREKARELKGAEKVAKERKHQNTVLGDIEVDKVCLNWVERSDEGTRHFNLEVDEPETLNQLLMMLTQLGLRGEHIEEAKVEAEE
jgi:hypothetical protein